MWSLASASLTRVDCRKKKKTRMRKAGKGPKMAGLEGRRECRWAKCSVRAREAPWPACPSSDKERVPRRRARARGARASGARGGSVWRPHPSLPALGHCRLCSLYLWPFGIFQMKQIPYLPRLFFFSMEIESLLSLGTDKTAWHHQPGSCPSRQGSSLSLMIKWT